MRVIPLYTHADPGEVERLRDQVDQWHDRCVERTTERDTLRAQPAERDSLLRHFIEESEQDFVSL